MFLGFIDQFFNILRDLLPSRDMAIGRWVAQLMMVVFVIVGIGSTAALGLRGTGLGEKWGLNPITKPLPLLTHTEMAATTRQIYEQLSQLRENNPDVRTTFLLTLYDPKTGTLVKAPKFDPKEARVLLWVWSVPVDKFSSLTIIENIFNNLKEEFIPRFSGQSQCISGEIKPLILEQMRRGINDFQSSHFSICPVYTVINRHLIAATVAFYKQPTNFQLYYFEDRLARATDAISPFFYDWSTKYETYFN